MKESEFYRLVEKMRTAQKAVPRARDLNVLMKAKELEDLVDKAIKEREERQQGSLF